MTRKFITRYAKIVHTGKLSPHLKFKAISRESNDLNDIGSHYTNFYKHFMQRLVFTGKFGKALLYPVRVVDTYVVAMQGKNKIFSSNQDILKYLVKKGIVIDSENLRKEFKEYSQLDFDKISEITGAVVEIYEHFSSEDDVLVESINGISCIHYIPCLHEPKIIIDAFLETRTLTAEIVKNLNESQMKEFESCFFPSSEVFAETFEKLNL